MKVAMKVAARGCLAITCAALLGGCLYHSVKPEGSAGAGANVPFAVEAYDKLLGKNVDDEGRVDYNGIDREAFERVFASVAASSPKSRPDLYPTQKDKEAYYIDAYNVLAWKNVLMRLPNFKNAGDEKVSFFFRTRFSVGGDDTNMKGLEDKIRKDFKDPRVHTALNCASSSCPWLPKEAFTAKKLDEQLDRGAKQFVAQKRNVDYDSTKGLLRLSRIFDWYKVDFGGEDAKVIAWINRYRAPDAQVPATAKVQYTEYDWRLNDQSLKR